VANGVRLEKGDCVLEIGGALMVQYIVHDYCNLEVNAEFHWQPVELFKSCTDAGLSAYIQN